MRLGKRITRIYKNEPMCNSGKIRVGDEFFAIDDKEISDDDDIANYFHDSGSSVTITFRRKGSIILA